ncbi:L,D-transpeptidase family protein [Marinomonas sp. 15G1-11]|uniref:L,D-transpeptidase family protein n=1 Tax=Marinomonas phaeophyticola TaxID=3004091 RepID=A0ABT4JXR0_9GAMM|nr:L,D-transpeptidase family protein [Marinomonas sp. 15G1-11]MCZ2723016.1 L,D-transpeptidase family protein [Marinomonas sp. 15G1-11]
MRSITTKTACICLTSLILAACSSPKTNNTFILTPPSHKQIETNVQAQVSLMLTAFTPVAGQAIPNNAVLSAYEQREYSPFWIQKDKIDPAIHKLLTILEESYTHGLNPVHYYTQEIKEYLALATPSQKQLAELDVITTIAFSSYAHDLSIGRYEPQLIDPNWQLDAPTNDWSEILFLENTSDMINFLPLLAPRHPNYQVLQKWLIYYQNLNNKEPDIRIKAGVPLTSGDQGERVAQLRARLIQLGDIRFSTRKTNEDVFDEKLKLALIQFQKRHDLTADGQAGAQTIEMLNIPVKVRAQQIAYNLERWRWLPSILESERIWVDLTDYKVHTYLNDRHSTMKAVIGKNERKTPVFKGNMTYMVTNPTWRVPHRIAQETLLPKIHQDPNYLTKHGYQVFSSWTVGAKQLDPSSIDWSKVDHSNLRYRFEQTPDDGNALGAYKFMFPNKNDIYLHDTPAKHLFKEDIRAFSSGCIRLERPEEFAQLLVSSNTKRANELSKAKQSKATNVISLPKELPVYLVYFTVVPNENGMPEFRQDIYQRDALMEEAMGYYPFNPKDSL